MTHGIDTRQDRDLKCLDGLIANFGGTDNVTQSQGPCRSLLEHLQAARRNLLGSMPGEYSLSLELARESVVDVPGKAARTEIKKILRTLIDSDRAL